MILLSMKILRNARRNHFVFTQNCYVFYSCVHFEIETNTQFFLSLQAVDELDSNSNIFVDKIGKCRRDITRFPTHGAQNNNLSFSVF